MVPSSRVKFFFGGILFGAVLLGAVFLVQYLALVPEGLQKDQEGEVLQDKEGVTSSSKKSIETEIEEVVKGLEVPWSLVFTSSERMLVTERPGRIRVVEKGVLQKESLHVFSEVVSNSEEGLMGLAVDPGYKENHLLYTSLAYMQSGNLVVKVMRFRDTGKALEDPFVVIDDIPAAKYHSGSRMKFGPDGKLYITTGDATDKNIAQDIQNLGGKTLRINADGSIPEDNPFSGSPVWTYGHRNAQGLAWQPETGRLYETEHGPTVFDGPAGGDEINRIEKGKNYGWPLVSHEKKRAGTEVPLLLFTPAIAPAGMTFYASDTIPQFTGKLFYSMLKGEGIMQATLGSDGSIQKSEKMKNIEYGRIRDVVEGPDGALYFLTSNRDGRGSMKAGDDRIFRIKPKGEKNVQ
ncbi:MAG: PQQ-dependent sugar dehydrogenase [Patescibacteria group bacterium]